MSYTSYSFKDNIVINNSKWIRWLNSNGTARKDILGVESNNVYLKSESNDLYINNDSNSYTYINTDNSNNVLIGSKLAIGIATTTNLTANLALTNNGFIGSNVKNGYIGISGSYSFSNDEGSLIKLYGNDSSNYGQLHFISGNHSTGHLNFYTGNNSLKFQIMNSGLINFSPNGSDIKLAVSNNETTITNITKITNTTDAIDVSSGAMIISGGLSIAKSLYVGESLITGNVVYGNVSYGNLSTISLGVGISKTISGTFSGSNNISSPTNITNLIFDGNNIRSFQGSVSVAIIRSSGGNLYENITIEGNYTDSGWSLFTSSIGDISGVELSITSMGQLRYTSSNITNWTSTTLRYVITYISNTNNYEGLVITSGTFIANALQLNDTTNAVLNSQNGSFYSVGGGTFEKDLVVKGNINFVGDIYNNGILFTGSGDSAWAQYDNNIAFTQGNIGIGTTSPNFKLHVEGDIFASGDITATSDIRLKTNIEPINLSEDKINKLNNLKAISFNRINEKENIKNKHIGFSAQDLEDIIPELVYTDTITGYKSIAYGNITAILLEYIKNLHMKIKEMEKDKNEIELIKDILKSKFHDINI